MGNKAHTASYRVYGTKILQLVTWFMGLTVPIIHSLKDSIMDNKLKFNAAVPTGATVKPAKETAWFVNLLLSIDGIEHSPRQGLAVANTEPDNIQELLGRMHTSGNTTALKVAVKSVTLADDYITHAEVDDPDLDKLLNTSANKIVLKPLQGNGKVYEPAMFWINYEVTTEYFCDAEGNDAVVYTSGTAITRKADRAFLSKLLKIVNEGGDIETEVTSVHSAVSTREYTAKKAIDF
jgi:hypothetical protein